MIIEAISAATAADAEAEFNLRIRMQGKKYFCRYLLLMFDHTCADRNVPISVYH